MTPLLLVHVCTLSRFWLFATPGLQSARLPCPWNFPGKNTGVYCHFPLQGMFLPQRWNPCLLGLLHWQVDSLPLSHLGNHHYYYHHIIISQPFQPKTLGTWPHRLALLSLRPKVEGLVRVEWLPCLKSNPRKGPQDLHTWPRAMEGRKCTERVQEKVARWVHGLSLIVSAFTLKANFTHRQLLGWFMALEYHEKRVGMKKCHLPEAQKSLSSNAILKKDCFPLFLWTTLHFPSQILLEENGWREHLLCDRVHPHRLNRSARTPDPPLLLVSVFLHGHCNGEPGLDNLDWTEFSPSYSHVLFPLQLVLHRF